MFNYYLLTGTHGRTSRFVWRSDGSKSWLRSCYTLLLLGLVTLFASPAIAQTYLSENFESSFSGSPASPTGWSQSTVHTVAQPTNLRFWSRNAWSGSVWSSVTGTTQAPAPASGSGVLWIDANAMGGSTTIYMSQRVITPTVDLSGAVNPAVRFNFFWSAASNAPNLKLLASNDGGTTWEKIGLIAPGFNNGVAGWQQMNIPVPAAYRVTNARFAFEHTNNNTGNNPFIDDFAIQEWNTSGANSFDAALGTNNWESTGAWNNGIVPSADNDVVIPAGVTVTIGTATNLAPRCRNLIINGTLNFGSTAANLLWVYGNVTVNNGGTLNLHNANTSGRLLMLGGNLTVNSGGTINFSSSTTAFSSASTVTTGAGGLYLIGAAAQTVTLNGNVNSGATSSSNRMPNLVVNNAAGASFAGTALTVTHAVGLLDGALNPANLTVGNNTISSTVTFTVANGTYSSAPTIAALTGNRNWTFNDNFHVIWRPTRVLNVNTGNYFQSGSILGNLTMNTFAQLSSSSDITFGNGSLSVSLTLTRGIINMNNNSFIYTTNVTGTSATLPTHDPSVAGPTFTYGSYIVGGIRVNYPTGSAATRTIPLGINTNNSSPIAQTNRAYTLIQTVPSADAAGQAVRYTVEASPTDNPVSPATRVFGTRAFRVQMISGNFTNTSNTLQLAGGNFVGNSDNFNLGSLADLRIVQSTSLAGPWTVRSVTTGSGAFVNNTNYTRTSATGVISISPIATNGEYFAWGTVASVNKTVVADPTYVQYMGGAVSGGAFPGTNNATITRIDLTGQGVNGSMNLTVLNVNMIATNTAHITAAKLWRTTSTSFVNPVLVATVNNPSVGGTQTAFSFTCNENITGNGVVDYFFITYDISSSAASGNTFDASIPIGGMTFSASGGAVAPTTYPAALGNPTGVLTITTNGGQLNYGVTRSTNVTWNPLTIANSYAGTSTASTFWTSSGASFSTDDNTTQAINFPFSFTYAGQTVTSFRACTNGWVSLNGAAVTGNTWTNSAGSIGSTVNTLVCPLWDDWQKTSSSNLADLYIDTQGVTPNRVLVVQWTNWGRFNVPAVSQSWQVKFYETSNNIEFVYGPMTQMDGTANTAVNYTLGLFNWATSSANFGPGSVLLQQEANTDKFSAANWDVTSGTTSPHALNQVPECFSSILFTAGGTLTAGTNKPAITNDEPSGAITIPTLSNGPTAFCDNYRNLGATGSVGISNCTSIAPGVADDDVWYKFDITTSVPSTQIALVPSFGMDGVLQVYSGTPGSLTPIACVNSAGAGLGENISLANLAAGTYFIRVYHFGNGSTGNTTNQVESNFILYVVAPTPPANDNCSGAQTLTLGAPAVTFTNVSGATLSTNIPSCGAGTPGNADDDVWFVVQGSGGTDSVIVTGNQLYDPVVQVYSGDCNNLNNINCVNTVAPGGTETIAFQAVAGRNYFIRVYHQGSGTNANGFNIRVVNSRACATTPIPGSVVGPDTYQLGDPGMTFNLTGNNTTATTVQWQTRISTTSTWTNLSSGSASLTNFSPTVVGTHFIRAFSTTGGNCVSDTTAPVSVTVSCTPISPVAGTVGSASANYFISDVGTFNLTGNTGNVIQWQISVVGASGPYSNIGGATTSTLNYTFNVAGDYWIRAQVNTTTSSCMAPVFTAPFTANVVCATTNPVAGTISGPSTVVINTNNTYTTSGQTGTLFNWQSGPSVSGPWTNISGGNTASLTYNASTVGTVFLRYEIRTTTNICQTPATATPIQVDAVLPQPPAADFTANSTTATTGGDVSTVTFTNASTNNPTSWTWTFTPNTVTFVNGTSASSQNPQVQFNAIGNYTVSLIATNAGGPSTAFTRNNYINVVFAYCASNATNTGDTKIDSVIFGSIVAGSAASNCETYTDRSNLVTNIQKLTPTTLRIVNGSCSGSHFSAAVRVYIDYNQNGQFDTDEVAYEFGQTTALSTIPNATIIIPNTALEGNTRMRVVLTEGTLSSTLPTACGTYSYGETEDYTINIQAAPPCTSPPTIGSISGSNTLFVTQTGNYTLNGSLNLSSVQWQASTTGLAGSWVNISGAVSQSQSLVANTAGTTFLRAFGTGGPGCITVDTSSSFSVTISNVPELAYTVSRQTGITYNSIISGGNNFSWPGTSTDDQMSSALDVSGLNFVYQGIPVTSLRVNSNGFVTFLGTNTSGFTNTLTSTGALAQLSPYWDDLVVGNNTGGLTQLNASIKYLITGVSPNQVMTIEWSDMGRFNNTNLNFAFQVKLYEGSNRIEFIYGNNVPYDGVANFDPTYSVGISSRVTTSSNYFISQAFENTANFTSGSTTGTAQDALAIPPTCNSMIRFQPSVSMSLPTDAAATVSNNEPASAESLTVPLGSYSDNCDVRVMRGATLNGSLTLPACAPSAFTAQNDVWYTFTTTGGGQHTINLTPNGGYDIAFQLLRGSISSLVNDTCVNAGAVGVREALTRTLLPNTTYYLRVVSNNVPTSSVGSFSIAVFRVATPPANDNCSGAITLAANTPVVSGNTGDATASTGFTSCGIGNANDDVWYSFTATGTFSTISVVPGAGFNPVVQVLTGACGTQTSVSCTNSTGINGTETVNITTVPGTTYFVRVYDFAASTPATGFTITLTTPVPACPSLTAPANNSTTVNSANNLTFSWGSVTGGTITYRLQVSDDPTFASLMIDSTNLTTTSVIVNAPRFAESTTYFWRVLAVNSNGSSTGCTANTFSTIGTVPSCIASSTPANGASNQATNVTLSWTAGGGAPTGYDVFFGIPGSLTLVSANQAGTSYATSGLANNTIYQWRIVPKNANGDAIGCQARSFTTVPAAPSNNECSNATSITVNGAALTGETSAFATQSQAPCTGAQANDVWYSFVATGSNQNISVVGAGGLNAIVQLFSGSCGSLTSISCVNNTGNNGSESINATGLVSGQTYFIRVYNANAGLSSGTSFSIEVTNQIVWNGTAWVGGTPGSGTAGTNITINPGSTATLPNGTECLNLIVSSGGNVSLGTGTVTIYGNITFGGTGTQTFGGTGTLIFGGSGTQTMNGGGNILFNGVVRVSTGSTLSTNSLILADGGVLMHGTGTVGGGGSFTGTLRQRRAGSTSNLRYNLWSSPMSGSTLSDLLGNDLYSFNGASQSWAVQTPATTMQVGVGYSATGTSNGFGGAGVRQFGGTPNNGNISVTMNVNPGLNDDWNLVGNPYPSAINGLTFISNNSDNIVGPLYFWNNSFSTNAANNNFTGADYATRSLASGPFHVGVGQGFFVEATSTLLDFMNGQRSTTNNVFLRNSSPIQRVTLLAHNAQQVANSTLIAFTADATDNYDRLWDARKYKGNPTVSLYSKVGSMDAAINAMGELSSNKVVALGMDVSTTGTHTIMIDQLENVDATTGIYLQDMQTGAMHNLRTSGYSFQAQAGSITNRFYVHFQPMVTSVVTVKQGQPTMVMSGDVLRINGLNEGTVVEGIQVLDMSGRRVISVSGMSESGQVERRVELPLGVYLIEVQTNRGVFTEKVFKSVR